MSAENSIQLFETLFYVSLGIAVLGLGLAVLFFFIYDIPTVYAFLTGKAKKETIERMAQQNAKTGKLRHNFESGELGRSGKLGKSGKLGRSGKLGQSGNLGQSGGLGTAVVHSPNVITEDFGGYNQPAATPAYTEPVAETSVLVEEQTTVLQQEPLTTVLQQEQEPLTTVLQSPAAQNAPVKTEADAGQTAILTERPPVGIRFDITENTTVIHTEEIL